MAGNRLSSSNPPLNRRKVTFAVFAIPSPRMHDGRMGREAGLTPAPQAIKDALYEGWDWFNQIGLYFADQLKKHPEVSTIFAAGTLAKLDIKTDLILGLLCPRAPGCSERKRQFHALSKPSYFPSDANLITRNTARRACQSRAPSFRS